MKYQTWDLDKVVKSSEYLPAYIYIMIQSVPMQYHYCSHHTLSDSTTAENGDQTSQGGNHQSSTASQQHEPMRLEIVVHGKRRPTDEPHRRLAERFKSVTDAKDIGLTPTGKYPRVPKVPLILRDTKDFKKQFEPRVVSVGPYHHHKPELQRVRGLKLRLTQRFVAKSGSGIDVLYRKIESDISELRNCYSKKATRRYNNEDLAWMMLVDGCSLLQYIHSYLKPDKLKEMPIIYQHASFVQQDLFLLENQLPFRVLELLLESRTQKDGIKQKYGLQMINQFISKSIRSNLTERTIDLEKEKPSHLLDLLRKRLLDTKPGGRKGEGGGGWNSFRNVNELKEAGIRFRPNQKSSWGEISFNSWLFFGFLKLPAITIDDSTKSRFYNLIAHEMCPDGPKDSGVTSYICFLDSLIDTPEDVRELRRKRILRNLLGSDEEVARLFNEIATDLVPDSDAYAALKRKIQSHCDNKMKTWLAEAWFTHFSSPWTLMAFLGAVIALFLTGVQTYYTLYPPGNH